MTTTSDVTEAVEHRRGRLERLLQVTAHAYGLEVRLGERDRLGPNRVILGITPEASGRVDYLALKGRALHLLGHFLWDSREAASQAEGKERGGARGFVRWWHALEDARLENAMARRWPGMAKAFAASLPPDLNEYLTGKAPIALQVELGLYLEGKGMRAAGFPEPVRGALDAAVAQIRRGAGGDSPQDSLAAMIAIYPGLREFARETEARRDRHEPADASVPDAAPDATSAALGRDGEGVPIIETGDDLAWAAPLGQPREFPEWFRPGSAPWFERGQGEKKIHPSVRQTDRETIVRPPGGDVAAYRALWSEVELEAGALTRRLIRCLEEETYLRYAGRFRSGKLAMSKLWKQRLADYRLFQRRETGGRPATAFSVLVDESASMKGHEKWRTAAKAAILVGECLARLELPFEIIGFTTDDFEARCAMKLGLTPAHEYRAMRCARLEHRIYKSFSESFPSVRVRLAGIQPRHNNWDDEHALFAYRRLRNRPELRKVLIVISDGQPNGEADHTIAAMARLEQEGCHVVGIGVGEAFVHQIYRSAFVVSDFRHMAEALVGVLARELGLCRPGWGAGDGSGYARLAGAA
ncbi:MAG TPA: hypothetical protein VLL77_07505 [Anaerolineales bacterium]|nr:hypothetical protein [Anaerolineales bacterium]